MPFAVGDRVEAQYGKKNKWYKGFVREDNEDGTYKIEFDDGDTSRAKPEAKIRLTAAAPTGSSSSSGGVSSTSRAVGTSSGSTGITGASASASSNSNSNSNTRITNTSPASSGAGAATSSGTSSPTPAVAATVSAAAAANAVAPTQPSPLQQKAAQVLHCIHVELVRSGFRPAVGPSGGRSDSGTEGGTDGDSTSTGTSTAGGGSGTSSASASCRSDSRPELVAAELGIYPPAYYSLATDPSGGASTRVIALRAIVMGSAAAPTLTVFVCADDSLHNDWSSSDASVAPALIRVTFDISSRACGSSSRSNTGHRDGSVAAVGAAVGAAAVGAAAATSAAAARAVEKRTHVHIVQRLVPRLRLSRAPTLALDRVGTHPQHAIMACVFSSVAVCLCVCV
jgi:hypothetical protein